MRFDRGADAIKPDAVMALAKNAERFAAPVFGRAIEGRLWFGQGEDELGLVRSRRCGDLASSAIVAERIREKFGQGWQQQLRIDIQRRIANGDIPCYLLICSRKI